MSGVADKNRIGILPAQDFGTEREFWYRVLVYCARFFKDAKGFGELDPSTFGPLMGFHLLQSPDQSVIPRQWSVCSPQSIREKTNPAAPSMVPLRAWGSPAGLVSLPAGIPFDLQFPGKWPGFVTSGISAFDDESRMWLPGFAGLVCPTFGGVPTLGTVVWDATLTNELNEDIYAHLQTFLTHWRPALAAPGFGSVGPASLAWQIGESDTGYAGGACADRRIAGPQGRAGRLIGLVRHFEYGGPFDLGAPNDKHEIEKTLDGESVNPVHLSTQALLIRPNGDGDGSIEDGGAWQKCRGGPINVFAFRRFDKDSQHPYAGGKTADGLWRFQSQAFIAIADGSEDPKQDKTVVEGGEGGKELPPVKPEGGSSAPRELASSIGEIGVRGLVLRASANFDSDDSKDTRNLVDTTAPGDVETASREFNDSPNAMRVDVHVSEQDYTGYPDSEDNEPRYTQRAARSATAWMLPANLGVEDFLNSQDGIPDRKLGDAALDLAFAFHRVGLLLGGTPRSGAGRDNSYKLDSEIGSEKDLDLSKYNESGVETRLAGLDYQGALQSQAHRIRVKNGTFFTITAGTFVRATGAVAPTGGEPLSMTVIAAGAGTISYQAMLPQDLAAGAYGWAVVWGITQVAVDLSAGSAGDALYFNTSTAELDLSGTYIVGRLLTPDAALSTITLHPSWGT